MVGLRTLEKRQKTLKLHRIVAYNFLELPDFNDGNYWTVNHKNGKLKWDCHVDNLEWMTFTENIRHSFREGLNTPRKGELNGKSNFKDSDIHEVCKMIKCGCSNEYIRQRMIEIGYDEKFLNYSFFYDIRNKRRLKHISDIYF
jgi:hypothetical protein